MKEIEVESVGEHVVVTPGRFEAFAGDEFKFNNKYAGKIEVMFLHDNLLEGAKGANIRSTVWCPVPVQGTSEAFKVMNGVAAGEYEYIVKYVVQQSTPNSVKARLGNAKVGLAIGGSSPRIIVKPPPG